MNDILHHYVELLTDPAHTLVEFTFVLIDVLIIDYVRRRLKRHFHRDLQTEHAAIDAEHGVEHHLSLDVHDDGSVWLGNLRILTDKEPTP